MECPDHYTDSPNFYHRTHVEYSEEKFSFVPWLKGLTEVGAEHTVSMISGFGKKP